jgi:hypothetical protein
MRSTRGWLGLVVVSAVFGLLGVGRASAVTPVTIGQTNAAADWLCGPAGKYDLNPGVASGTGYVVPPGTWTITSWSTFAGSFGGSMSMMVFRPGVPGPGNSLPSKVKQIQASVAASDKPGACSMLGAFNKEVKAQSGKKLTTAQAASFTAQANAIRAALGC